MSSRLSLRRAALASTTLLALLCAIDARAVPVMPGAGPTAQPGITDAADPALTGTVIYDVDTPWASANDPDYGFPGATGELQSRVVREDGTGTLDFYWRVMVDGTSYPSYTPDSLTIAGLSLANAGTGGAFDANWRIDGLGSAAPVDASATANSLTWDFSPNDMGPGVSTFFLLLHTTATSYDVDALADLGASSIATVEPSAPVPEPAPGALLAAGLAALGLLGRRLQRSR